ncbi:ATP-grasp domain-containing protein [Methylobacterium sp. NEAU 140]|uniref:ATP-grasp domain-containing protein n=1 Tax=Methylobacterium sp. NEAU 140 TaxID=3064945 RepID=UPI0027348F53|nr:ATP-grasp domain-containing protein [Methylobacterium sp. NEAU 140]MDP4022280.1 ATP-grasp domain-containing protein [Methylobacterium sp. NEAU 140]
MAETVLIAAQSGRALAEAARRAGLAPRVADLFGDSDTLELADAYRPLPGRLGAGLAADAVLAALDALVDGAGRCLGLVLGSGFEDAPTLVAAIGARHRLIGAGPETIAALKDPLAFAALCARLGVPHPAVSVGPVPDPENWLLKRAGGSGGGHIRAAGRGQAPPGHYLQARAPGRPCALNFLAERNGIRPLALTEQWCAPSPIRPFRYGGALAPTAAEPPALPAAITAAIVEAAEKIAAATGLRGLASADVLADDAGWRLTEINPRPGATLDVLDRRGAPLFAAHVAACLGGTPEIGAAPVDAAASRICYAGGDHAPVPALAWPDYARDRPRPGSTVRRDAPLCTVLATGKDGGAARAALDDRTARLEAALARATAH